MEENRLKFTKKVFFSILLFALIGLVLSGELSEIFYKTNFIEDFQKSFCSVSELIDCDGVAQTPYSLTFGVPNALWGIFVYSLIIFLLFVDRIQDKFKNTIFDVFKNPRCYIATISLFTFLASMILAGISIFVIKKVCILCFCTYFVDYFIALIAKQKGFFVEDIKITVVDFIEGVKKYTILFFVVLIAFVSTLVYLDQTVLFSPKIRTIKQNKEFFEAKTNKYAVRGNVLGKENAPVKIEVFSDFNCPFCKILNIMLHKLARKGNILVEEFNYPLDNSCNYHVGRTLNGHELSCFEAKTAIAAKRQGKFFDVANILYYNNFSNSDEILDKLEKANLGLDMAKLKDDIYGAEVYAELNSEINRAFDLNISGTPAYTINGVLYIGGSPYAELKEKIDLAVKRRKINN